MNINKKHFKKNIQFFYLLYFELNIYFQNKYFNKLTSSLKGFINKMEY